MTGVNVLTPPTGVTLEDMGKTVDLQSVCGSVCEFPSTQAIRCVRLPHRMDRTAVQAMTIAVKDLRVWGTPVNA